MVTISVVYSEMPQGQIGKISSIPTDSDAKSVHFSVGKNFIAEC